MRCFQVDPTLDLTVFQHAVDQMQTRVLTLERRVYSEYTRNIRVQVSSIQTLGLPSTRRLLAIEHSSAE